MERIGLICGYGEIASIAERAVRALGYEPVVVKISKFKVILSLIFGRNIAPIRPADILELFKSKGVRKIAIVGKFPKAILFAKFSGDEIGLKLEREADKRDLNIYEQVRNELAARGFELIPQASVLSSLLAPNEGFWGSKPSANIMRDLEKARDVARAIAALGAGQTAVVKNGAVIALEAFEHTDLTIKRAVKLAKGGYVVAKVPWPNELDLDMPAVGTKTIRLIAKSGGHAIGVIGKATIIITPESVKRLCEDLGVTLYFFVNS